MDAASARDRLFPATFAVRRCRRARRTEFRPRAVSLRVNRNAAVLLLDQFLDDGESHSGAFHFVAASASGIISHFQTRIRYRRAKRPGGKFAPRPS